MRFDLVDSILELSDEHAVTIKHVTMAEEYLQDHFPTFPVLPGVMMLEAMVQAARLISERTDASKPLVLGEVRSLKYNRFVPPGSTIRAEVTSTGVDEHGAISCRGTVVLLGSNGEPDSPAAAGRFTLRPVRMPSESVPAEVGRGETNA